MSPVTAHAEVTPLKEKDLEAAIEVFARSFFDYPIMRYFFSSSGKNYEQHVRALFRFSCLMRLALLWPILGCFINEELVGAAYLTPPEGENAVWPQELQQEMAQLGKLIPEDAKQRFDNFQSTMEYLKHPEPHYFLVAIGVLPQYQGTGCGKVLLEACHALSRSHPTSCGIGLDTEVARNVEIYERFGYNVLAQTKLAGIDIWSMFRKDEG